jgi:hypothetical protein
MDLYQFFEKIFANLSFPIVNDWGITLHEEFTSWDENRRSHMKRDTDEDEEKPAKKSRATASSSADNLTNLPTNELKKLVGSDGLRKHTIPQLKALCSAKGISGISGSKKQDLLDAVEQWVEEHCS